MLLALEKQFESHSNFYAHNKETEKEPLVSWILPKIEQVFQSKTKNKNFYIYQILDCSTKVIYSSLPIAKPTAIPVNASNTSSGTTKASS